MPCRVCNADSGSSVFAFGKQFWRCSICFTVQLEITRVQYEALEITYDSGSWIMSQDPQTIEKLLQIDEKEAFLRKYAPRGAHRLLDIGCGMGGYLKAGERLGMNGVGYEPSGPHSQIAREVFGLKVRPNYFTGTDEQFDLILLSHVIEHIFDPEPFLATIAKSLADGGRLVVITPNAASISARASGAKWPMLVPQDHVTMLTPEAMSRIVPPQTSLTIATSEYPYEFAATLVAAVRAKPATLVGAVSPHLTKDGLLQRAMKAALTIASFPAYLMAMASNRRGALIAIFDRTLSRHEVVVKDMLAEN